MISDCKILCLRGWSGDLGRIGGAQVFGSLGVSGVTLFGSGALRSSTLVLARKSFGFGVAIC